MARIFSAGLETRDISEFSNSGGSPTASATKAYSGSYSLVFGGTLQYVVKDLATTPAELYLALKLNHNGVSVNATPIFEFFNGTTALGSLRLNKTTHTLAALSSTSTTLATSTSSLNPSQWYIVEVHYKLNDSGLFVVKVDGVEVINYSGDTKPGSEATITSIRIGSNTTNTSFAASCYCDDIIINDTTGLTDNGWIGDVRLIPFFPNGNGNYSQFTGSDGNSTDNYALVDDLATGARDNDTTYVKATSADLLDTYAMTSPTLPDGIIQAVKAVAIARKTDGGIASTLAMVARLAGTDATGTARDLPTSYGPTLVSERFTTKPGGGSWSSSDIPDLELGFASKGAYA